jgi:CheY-like chemotaxis protein
VPEPILPVSPAADEPEPDADSKKVLVADDDPVIRQALTNKLKSRGYRVVTAEDCSQALNITRLEKPDVLLLDIDFPPDVAHGGAVPWNGFILSQWLRREETTGKTPIIFMSANDQPDYRRRASAAGGTAFLAKPIDSEKLLASIDGALTARANVQGAAGSMLKSVSRSAVPNGENSGDRPSDDGRINHLSIGGL